MCVGEAGWVAGRQGEAVWGGLWRHRLNENGSKILIIFEFEFESLNFEYFKFARARARARAPNRSEMWKYD